MTLSQINWQRILVEKWRCSASQKNSPLCIKCKDSTMSSSPKLLTLYLTVTDGWQFWTTDNVVKYTALPLCIQEVLSSDLSPKTGYPDPSTFVLLFSPFRQMPGWYSNQAPTKCEVHASMPVNIFTRIQTCWMHNKNKHVRKCRHNIILMRCELLLYQTPTEKLNGSQQIYSKLHSRCVHKHI
jgi:hypothetical protein